MMMHCRRPVVWRFAVAVLVLMCVTAVSIIICVVILCVGISWICRSCCQSIHCNFLNSFYITYN